MHLFHIYCQIKDWIHGDDTSYELIKIVQVYGKWMMKIKDSFCESLSPLFGGHGTWLSFSSLIFGFFSCHFGPFLSVHIFSIAYALLQEYWRDRSLHVEFYFVDG
jgi:hypothetical protein